MNIALVQSLVPHYRSEFLELLGKKAKLDVFTFNKNKDNSKLSFSSETKYRHIKRIKVGPFLWFNPFTLLKKKYDTIVLMWHFGHISTWFLLLTKWIHRKNIILWGQGISVKRYLIEEKKPNRLLKWMLKLADGAWIYMDKEYEQWHKIYPNKPMIALQNSLSGVNEMLEYEPEVTKEELKEKYNINQERIFIFSARFSHKFRRTDLLEEIISKLDKEKNGFIIIGDGQYKPDFSKYSNVYDFGALYDTTIKRELFSISDLYLQPGWVGLSIVEAMAYGCPICTFERSTETLQCVEYSYIKDGENGMIFKNMEDAITRLESLNYNQIVMMSANAKETARNSSPENMVKRAISILNR